MNVNRQDTLERFGGILKTTPLRLLLSTLVGGFAMWVEGGLWHNLILPIFNSNVQAHHDGLVIVLISYFVLAFLMTYIFLFSYQTGESVVIQGLKMGVVIGVLWVFPHGLAMAGTHNTSIVYEIQNTLYHMIEQGIGGIVVAFIMAKRIR
ncbi:MAG: hypothetical protein HZB50_10310 [Chloroflexi bacterium]|nr:hypothetical protein [Chloroflexota bacterium]